MYTSIRRYLRSAKSISIHNNLPSVSLACETNSKDKFLFSKMPTPQLFVMPKKQFFPSHNLENLLASTIFVTCVSWRNTMSNPKLLKRENIISCLNFCLKPPTFKDEIFSTILCYNSNTLPLKSLNPHQACPSLIHSQYPVHSTISILDKNSCKLRFENEKPSLWNTGKKYHKKCFLTLQKMQVLPIKILKSIIHNTFLVWSWSFGTIFMSINCSASESIFNTL